MEDINTYQMAKTPSKLIHFPRSYSPKTGVMTSSFWAQFCREQDLDGPRSTYCYTSMKDEMVGISDVLISKEVCVWGLNSSPWSGQTFMIQSWSKVIRPQAQMRSDPGPKWDWALGPNEIWSRCHMLFGLGPRCSLVLSLQHSCHSPGHWGNYWMCQQGCVEKKAIKKTH